MWIMESEYYLTEEKMNNKKLLFMKLKKFIYESLAFF